MPTQRLPVYFIIRVSVKDKWTPKLRVVSEALMCTKVNGLLLLERS